jgi:hypothetical protein
VVDIGALALLKFAVSAGVIAAGVTAISDDDFSRVVLAQQFAARPRLDPTGSSWLPVPFWVYGSALAAFGRTLEVARAVAVGLGIVSVGFVWASARLLGLAPRAALLGGALAACFPYSAWLGVAAVPELPSAALLLMALAAVAQARRLARRGESSLWVMTSALAALAVTLAAGSRYEAWPVAGGVAGVTWLEAASGRVAGRWRTYGVLVGFVALSFPLAWLAHGHFVHGDTWFFVRRVAEYKAALGTPGSSAAVLFAYPVAFVRSEPELLLLAASSAVLWARRAPRAWQGWFGGLQRPLLLLLLQLAVLILGDIRGGGPTHHPERALVCGWLLAAVVAGGALDGLLRGEGPGAGSAWLPGALAPRAAWRRSALAALLCLSAAALLSVHRWVRRADLHVGSFVQRLEEIEIGRVAREHVPPGAQMAVATDDYGYFAVIAAFGAPEATHVFADHDPRRPQQPELSPRALRSFAARTGSQWAVVPTSWLLGTGREQAEAWGRPVAENAGFALLALDVPPPENSPLREAVH